MHPWLLLMAIWMPTLESYQYQFVYCMQKSVGCDLNNTRAPRVRIEEAGQAHRGSRALQGDGILPQVYSSVQGGYQDDMLQPLHHQSRC